MTWRKPADRSFVKAIVSAFREESDTALEQLMSLPEAVWEQSDYWLDASGMALYLHQLLSTRRMGWRIPPKTWDSLRTRARKNKRRSEALFGELREINEAFRAQGLLFANHKGFTLCPHACSAPELRHQLDLDFLIAPECLEVARECLEKRGYRISAAGARTWEFKAGNIVRRKRWDNYNTGTYRSLELHFGIHSADPASLEADPRLGRLSAWNWRGEKFPALSPADQMLAQGDHLFSHLRNESTRLSWILEFRRHVVTRRDDTAFWNELTERARRRPRSAMAFGLSIYVASALFGQFAPAAVEAEFLDSLPGPIRLWAEHYGERAVLADFPGTKLYLLLESQLEAFEGRRPTAMRTRLFPVRAMPPCFPPARNETAGDRWRRYALMLKFILFRLRFHGVEAVRVALEMPRWHRRLRTQRVLEVARAVPWHEMTNRKQLHDNLGPSPR